MALSSSTDSIASIFMPIPWHLSEAFAHDSWKLSNNFYIARKKLQLVALYLLSRKEVLLACDVDFISTFVDLENGPQI
jgi:hypothetical protein